MLSSIQMSDTSYYRSHYKKMVSMNAENVDIGYVYNNLILKVRRDFDVIRMSVLLDVFWEIVFVLQSMVTIGFGLDEFEITDEDNRYKTFRTITNKLKKLLGIKTSSRFRDGLATQSICHCAVELLTNHLQKRVLNYADNSLPLTGALSRTDAIEILSDVFSKQLFEKYCDEIKRCTKKILFALDGFDTHSEEFRMETNALCGYDDEEYRFRSTFENTLFRELVFSVYNAKKQRFLR